MSMEVYDSCLLFQRIGATSPKIYLNKRTFLKLMVNQIVMTLKVTMLHPPCNCYNSKYLLSSLNIFEVPKSVIRICMSSPNKIFSGFKSLQRKKI